MVKSSMQSFLQLLKAVDYPAASTFDEETVSRLFLNMDNNEKETLFKWIVMHFDASLESYAVSDEKLRYLLLRTALLDSKNICASFLSGLLPHNEQLDVWKNILAAVYYHTRGQKTPKATSLCPLQTVTVPQKSKVNLLPPEYQKEFEKQTKGNYSEYLATMKEKLLISQQSEDEMNDSIACENESCDDLEEVVQKVLNSQTPPNFSASCTSLDLGAVAKFCSNYERSLKPQLPRVLDEVDNQNVVKLPHLGEFLQEYRFLSAVLTFFKVFESATDRLLDRATSAPQQWIEKT